MACAKDDCRSQHCGCALLYCDRRTKYCTWEACSRAWGRKQRNADNCHLLAREENEEKLTKFCTKKSNCNYYCSVILQLSILKSFSSKLGREMAGFESKTPAECHALLSSGYVYLDVRSERCELQPHGASL